MKHCLLFSIFFTLIAMTAGAQERGRLTGRVLSESAEPLEDVQVNLLNSPYQTTTSVEGTFSFTAVPYGSYILSVSKRGYSEITRIVNINSEVAELEIILSSEGERLKEVIVTAQKREEI
ncbi:MAG: carboxypeptidase-like regulatory domain-containing protein, partial [Salinimicrobium sediminis]|nr:carboxypeptidase-like regulatory domain-containing protein [Salinimicrobium sediminis]